MYKVLIVEDDPMVSMINEQYVKRNKNFEVAGTVKDGKSALKFLSENAVDLLLLDVYMPLMNGFETLRLIRQEKHPVEVIMVTAANDREALEEALHLGVVDYLVKPFTFDRFCMALEKYTAQVDALRDLDKLNQKSVDYIIESNFKKGEDNYRKGIQDRTLQMLLGILREQPEKWFTGDEVAEKTGLSGVTVRRYMNYLTETGKAIGDMNYETGGRPSMRYRLAE